MLATQLQLQNFKMAAALVRLKRRYDEEPLDALILNCKRRKTCSDDEKNELSTVLKFAGTTDTQEEDVFKHIRKPTKTEIEEQFKKHQVNINDKIRQEIQTASKNNRYKVVNLHRSHSTDAPESEKELTIVDIETDENKEESVAQKKTDYVYDLYYTTSDDLQEVDVNELISLYPLSNDLVYGSPRDNGHADPDSDDSEDSNAENNWRNDYPDESDMESITEDDMIGAVKNLDLNGDRDLSSDDGEEGFVYSIDSEAAGFEEDVDPSDVRRYGEMYARFKARVKKLEEPNVEDHNFYYGDIDEEEYYY